MMLPLVVCYGVDRRSVSR